VLDPQVAALLSQLGIDAAFLDALVSGAIILTVVTLVAAIPTVMIAKRKHRVGSLWLLLALSIPVLPLLLVWLLPALPSELPPGKSSEKD